MFKNPSMEMEYMYATIIYVIVALNKYTDFIGS